MTRGTSISPITWQTGAPKPNCKSEGEPETSPFGSFPLTGTASGVHQMELLQAALIVEAGSKREATALKTSLRLTFMQAPS